jgi:hypothetical protein
MTPVYKANTSALMCYRDGDTVYAADTMCRLFGVKGRVVYGIDTDEPLYLLDGEWWYDLSGLPTFYENFGFLATQEQLEYERAMELKRRQDRESKREKANA